MSTAPSMCWIWVWFPWMPFPTPAAWMIARMEAIVKHLEIPTSLKEFNVPAEDLEGLVEAGMSVQRLLVNNMITLTPDDARKLYQEIL